MSDHLEESDHGACRDGGQAPITLSGARAAPPRPPAFAASRATAPPFDALFRHGPLPQWLLAPDLTVLHHNLRAGRLLPGVATGHLFTDALPMAADRSRLCAPRHRVTSPFSLCGLTLSDGDAGARYRGDLHLACLPGPGEGWLSATWIDRTADLERHAALDHALAHAVQAGAAKTQFLAGLGHELRTPLNAVIGMAQLILARPAPAPAVVREADFAQVILDAGRYMDHLLAGFLDLQAAELGRLQVRPEVFDLADALRDAVAMTAHRFTERRVVLHAPHAGTAMGVRADPVRCRQVAINLLDNAAKYTAAGRSVVLSTRPDGHGWRVEVLDAGAGLSETQQRELFQPFHRLGAEHTWTPGLGMGLALSRQLVERMNGRIGCRSAPGQGSTFWFWLPCADVVPAPVLP